MSQSTLFDNLTGPQLEAVRHVEGPLLVLAGAGSGKTRVITRRAVHIARTTGRPEQVLAITFTNKAAGEMRERIFALGISQRMWVHTFHSLCARLLREYAGAAGISPTYSIFDEADRRSVIREAIAECGLRPENWQPRVVEEKISEAKNRLLTPAEYGEEASDFTGRTIAQVYAKYEELMAAQQACDFDDLLMRFAVLLRNDEAVRAELAERFQYLLIDEYQDTNHAQYMIASQMAAGHRNICATGDPDQSIYAWRGADIRNILDFEADYPDAKIVRLEQNFRSTGAILSAASCLIDHNKHRKPKTLFTEGDVGASVRVWSCEDERQEASRIADDIREALAEGRAAGDVAIFYRVNALSRAMEDALRSAGIPYQIARGVEFYGRKEIKDVLAYMRIIENPADETALFRAMGAPSRGIGKATMQKIAAMTREGRSLDEALEAMKFGRGASAKRIGEFVEMLERLRAMPRQPVREIVERVLKESGLEASLSGQEEIDNEPLANVYELVNAAGQFDADQPEGKLGDWLQQISLVSDADAIEEAGGTVTLMTLHTAKGLEYPVVYVIGLEEGLLPHKRSLAGEESEVEEERRLCFVGMTRAKERLTLSGARYRMIRGITERTIASRFLRELPDEEIERDSFESPRDRSMAHLGEYNDGQPPMEAGGYHPGQRVRHEEYGDGEVVALEPRGRSVYVRIHFNDYGERSFAMEHVSLIVMDA